MTKKKNIIGFLILAVISVTLFSREQVQSLENRQEVAFLECAGPIGSCPDDPGQ